MEENIHAGHRDRMRKRFKENGFSGWEEHEVIEYMLYRIHRRANTNPIAHELIKKCGGFSQVWSASELVLKKTDFVGDKCAEYLFELGEFVNYCNKKHNVKDRMSLNFKNTEQYLEALFKGKTIEYFYMICLNSKMEVLDEKILFKGSFESTEINMNEIIRYAVEINAASVVLAHNHPSGILIASDADISATKIIAAALRMIKVKVAEHFIVTDDGCIGIIDKCHISDKKDFFY